MYSSSLRKMSQCGIDGKFPPINNYDLDKKAPEPSQSTALTIDFYTHLGQPDDSADLLKEK